MPFTIERNDIARVHADVLVNAANEQLAPGGGVCGALFEGAGYQQMLAACRAIGHTPTGSAATTPGFDLPCRWVVHAVGPVWRGGSHGEEQLLRQSYRSMFAEVARLGASSVAFPLISAGIYGYPVRDALRIAREETAAFLDDHDDVHATLVVFTRDVIAQGGKYLADVRAYIDDTYVETSPHMRNRTAELADLGVPSRWAEELAAPCAVSEIRVCGAQHAEGTSDEGDTLIDLLDHLDEPFSTTLLALIDARGFTDTQVYKRANISRQLFSKIRSNPAYQPSKPTAVALGMALELTYDELQDLLARAGFTLSHSSKFDVIVEFFIMRGDYNIFDVNEALFAFDQPLLGSA